MPFYERNNVRIHYQDTGSGFPLLLIPGGGLNSRIDYFTGNAPFNAIEEFSGEYRCVTADLRNANGGKSTGSLEPDRPWDMFTDDHLGLMDHLGIRQFMVMGFCIGGPLVWNLIQRAQDRVVAAVLAQPSGFRPEVPNYFYELNAGGWAAKITPNRPDLPMATCDAFLKKMYGPGLDFVLTATRDFVRGCETPLLFLPDDVTAHPYKVAMEAARIAPNAQVTLYPWKEEKETIRLAVRHVRTFLQANRPQAA